MQNRSVKTEEEIQRMVIAANYTKDGILNALNQIEEGMTEIESLKIVQKEMTTLSNELGWALVQFGENSAIPHGHPSKKKLRQDDVILIDAGTTCEHYFSDITVTTSYGKTTKEFLEIYEVVEKANEIALEVSREGTAAEDVDFAARKSISKAGYGKYFTHRLGHGLGLEVHEEPYIVKGNSEPLRTGNVHTDEPGIYLPNKFGIRIEDDVLVGKKSKRLVEFDRHLWK
ncbi:MAG: M24 family metallopeptidase [Candidatus Heimdallarchaeota archaeon]|nr:M24 family metallopeptidase [Candidatus Heimdallarchaeota archaeon]